MCRLSRLRSTAAALIVAPAIGTLALSGEPAWAGCNTSNGTTTCTGNVYPNTENVNSTNDNVDIVRSFYFRSLNSDVNVNSEAITIFTNANDGSSSGDPGKNSPQLNVSIDTAPIA